MEAAKHRARLALLAERAFGLNAVVMPRGRKTPLNAVGAPSENPPAPVRAPRPAVQPGPPATPPRRQVAAASAKPARSAPLLRLVDEPPITGAPLSTDHKRLSLQQLDENHVRACTKCGLSAHRTQTVFGEGDPDAKIMFVGEGPGENEDLAGRPFVGRAGEKLDDMIRAMGLRREQVYIANIVKCRPPGNRTPAPDEVLACTPYLRQQIETVRPQVIVTLGAPATKFILGNDKISISRVRGQWHDYRGIKVMPTFHPAYMLRSYTREVRAQVWSDIQAVMREVGLPLPKRGGEAP